MGTIADMMINGDMCHVCGVMLDDSYGYATTCEACSEEEENDED